MPSHRTVLWLLLAGILMPAHAILGSTIALTGNAPTTLFVGGPCGPWAGCGITSSLSFSNTQTITDRFVNLPGDESFATAFTTWNTATGAGWTLLEQAALANLAYTIGTFNTSANTSGGGVQIGITVAPQAGYNGPPTGDLVWTQGLEIDYTVAPNGGAQAIPSINTLDDYYFNTGGTASGGSGNFSNPCLAIPTSPNNTTPSTIGASPAGSAYCDPIYPFQDGRQGFFDHPQGIYPMDSFRGEAFLSTVNTRTKTLTVYDGGVNYGFDLFVTPEPSLRLLAGAVLVLLLAVRRFREQHNQHPPKL
jgi:hypothetical protein